MIAQSIPKPNIKLTVPFYLVSDMERSLGFYVNKLGFTIVNQWMPQGKIEWCWLQRDAVALMLQEPKKDIHIEGKPGNGVSTCYQCEDALALYREFLAKDICIKEPFVGNGMWAVIVEDPDGYKHDFESITDMPEETTYTMAFGNG